MLPRCIVFNAFLLATTLVATTPVCNAQLPTIRLQTLSTLFFKPGESVDVTLVEGAFLEDVSKLVFSAEGIQSQKLNPNSNPNSDQKPAKDGKTTFRVTVDDDVPAGRYDVRVVGRFGVSNPRSIIVHPDVIDEARFSDAVEAAIPIELNQILQATAQPRKHVSFSFPVERFQEYEVTLIAATIDSHLFPSISVRDENGTLIRSVIGNDSQDLTLRFSAGNRSSITLAVHDAVYRGGPSFGFGIVVRSVETSENQTRFRSTEFLAVRSVSARPFSSRDLVSPSESHPLPIPSLVEGFLGQSDRQHHYLCQLKQSQPVRIEVQSDRLGQSTDLRMLVEIQEHEKDGPPRWKRVSIADDIQSVSDSIMRLASRDPVLRFSPPKDGTYRITLIDANRSPSLGEAKFYRLRVSPDLDHDWRVLAYPVYPHRDVNVTRPRGVLLRRGGAMVYRVFVLRDGMNDPVRISASELPEGCSAADAWIAANQNQTDLVITAKEDIAKFSSPLQIMGQRVPQEPSAEDDPDLQTARAATVSVGKSPVRQTCRTRLADSLWIAGSDKLIAPVSIFPQQENDEMRMMACKKGESIKWPIKIVRREGGKEPIVLRPRNLPPGVKVPELTIPKDKTEAVWNIEVTSNANPGTYSFWGQGETKVKSIDEKGSKKDFTMFVPTSLFVLKVK